MAKKKIENNGTVETKPINEDIAYLDYTDKMVIQGYYYKKLFYESKLKEIMDELQQYLNSISKKYGNIVEIVDLENGVIKVENNNADN